MKANVDVTEGSPWSDAALVRHSHRLTQNWRRSDGVLGTVFRGTRCIDDMPLVGELGDVAPFLVALGRIDVAIEQAALSAAFLSDGLFMWKGRTRLFNNHDFLLGLSELYQTTREPWVLARLQCGMNTLVRRFEVRGLLTDELVRGRMPLWPRASPFNGGFIELCVDLSEYDASEQWLHLADRWARAWVSTPTFQRIGLFGACNWPKAPLLADWRGRLRRSGPVQLFKDNTNLVWSLLALYRVRKADWIREALEKFVCAFRKHLFHDGYVRVNLAAPRKHFDLYGSMPSLDLLCDLAAAGVEEANCLKMARLVAHRVIEHQWADGRIELASNAGRDHLDMNVDVGVGLCKLGELTGEPSYRQVAMKGWHGTVRAHETPDGLILSTDSAGRAVDDRIVVKYQYLAVKSHVLATAGVRIYENRSLWSLLRDR